MGYIRKCSTVCNPAKRSLTVFQNSFQETYYVTEQQPYQVTVPTLELVDNTATVWVGAGNSRYVATVQNYTSVPIRFQDMNGNTYTLQPGDAINTTTYFNINASSVVSLDPSYTLSYRDGLGTQWVRYNRYKQTGSHQETRYRDVQVPKTRTTWNTRWRKLSA